MLSARKKKIYSMHLTYYKEFVQWTNEENLTNAVSKMDKTMMVLLVEM